MLDPRTVRPAPELHNHRCVDEVCASLRVLAGTVEVLWRIHRLRCDEVRYALAGAMLEAEERLERLVMHLRETLP